MEENKHRILTEAEKLFMRYGLKSVSMDDIARALGMSKKTLYQYFSNKKDLISMVMELNGARDIEVLTNSAHDSKDAIDEYLINSRYFISEMRKVSPTTLYDLKKYYPAIWQAHMVEHVDRFIECISVNVTRGVEEGLYREDLMPDILAKIYAQTVLAIADSSLFPAREVTIDRIIYQHAMYHLHGIVNAAGRERLSVHLRQKNL